MGTWLSEHRDFQIWLLKYSLNGRLWQGRKVRLLVVYWTHVNSSWRHLFSFLICCPSMRRYFVDSHYMELTSKLSLGRKSKDELVLPEAALPGTLSDGRKKLCFLPLLTVFFCQMIFPPYQSGDRYRINLNLVTVLLGESGLGGLSVYFVLIFLICRTFFLIVPLGAVLGFE